MTGLPDDLEVRTVQQLFAAVDARKQFGQPKIQITKNDLGKPVITVTYRVRPTHNGFDRGPA